MKVLLAALGDWDPDLPALTEAGPLAGPILRVAALRAPRRVLLLHDPRRYAEALEVQRRLVARLGEGAVFLFEQASPLELADVLRAARASALLQPGDALELLPADPFHERAWMRVAVAFDPAAVLLRVHLGAAGDDDMVEVVAPAGPGPDFLVREPRAQYLAAEPLFEPEPESVEADPAVVARRLGLIGSHAAFLRECEKAAAVAPHSVPLLIFGETGTGKGLMARYIHDLSPRARKPFVPVNCSALPEQLAESLLFGHVRGAFTGAASDQPGKFVQADGGTLFLDEIGELPPALQPKLLRVLEDGWVEPLGAARPRRVDVRVMAATHRDLKAAVAEKTFREDLYFRLSFATLQLPALRERRSDIQALALHALQRINQRLRGPKRLSAAALDRLEQQPWRGNVRDLENAIGRSALMARGEVIGPGDLLLETPLPAAAGALPEPCEGFSLEDYLSDARRRLIEKALEKTDGRQAAAARLLGLSPQAVSKYVLQSRPAAT